MAPILDAFQYPWSDPLARELHLTLTRLNPTRDKAVAAAASVDIPEYDLDTQKAVLLIWRDILDEGARRASNRKLVELVRESLAQGNPQRAFLDRILADERPPIDIQPRNADGSASFLAGSDAVTQSEEALLFRDDLTIGTGQIPAFVGTLQKLQALAPAVCKIEARFVDPGSGQITIGAGTGFRVGPDRVMTNWHVLHDRSGNRASKITLEFGFEDDAQGRTQSTVVPADVAGIVGDKGDDWAILRPEDPLDSRFVVVDLEGAAEPVVGESAFIIQHPGGRKKRVGFVRNPVSDVTDRVLHYLTDTQEGSSGSPVFDADGRLIGLHRSGGTPQDKTGSAPITKNEGVRIPRIVAGMQDRGLLP